MRWIWDEWRSDRYHRGSPTVGSNGSDYTTIEACRRPIPKMPPTRTSVSYAGTTRFVRLAAEVSELTITPEGLLCGDHSRTWRSPPPGEMVLNLSEWRRANWDHIRVPVPWLFCAGSSRPASALLAAEMHIASRKVGLSRMAFSAHDDAMS